MILQEFAVNNVRFEYGKLKYDPYNMLFIVEGITGDSEFVRIQAKKLELELYRSDYKDKETWQYKPKNVKSSEAVETPLEPIASACAALASATPASASATPASASATMTDTAPMIKRGRGRPRKVVQQ